MSFFFIKQATSAPKLAAGTTPAPRLSKAQAATLQRLGCVACPLNKADVVTPKMEPTLSNGSIYFMAEAPGRDEDEVSHRPLSGPSGQLLRSCIPLGEERKCSFDNVCNCRPPQNRTPTWQEIECCRSRRIKWIEQTKPKLIVGLGAIPLQWALGSVDLQGMRGRLFAIKVGNHSCYFLPTYHPSFILRIAFNKKKPLQSRLGHCFKMDIKRAFEVVDSLEAPSIPDEREIRARVQTFTGANPTDFGRLCALLNHACEADARAIDIETTKLRPFSSGARILSIAISTAESDFSFMFSHKTSRGTWTSAQRAIIAGLCKRLIGDGSKTCIAHNAPFELEWFVSEFGPEVVDHAAWECTQMQAHFLDERRGKRGSDDDHRAPYQGLDFLCKQHFGFPFKHLFKFNKKDMASAPIDELLVYNAFDTHLTLKLWERQNQLLKEQGLYDAYLDSLPRQPTVALMQSLGVGVDQKEIRRAQGQLDGEITDINAEIDELPVVEKFKTERKTFNPQSGPDAISIFQDYIGHQLTKANGKTSIDKGALEGIDHPLAKLIIRLRNRTKMKSTYVDDLVLGEGRIIFPDGKLHTNFNTTFTETGRLSSDLPNLQNFPKRNDNWIRRTIVAPPGHLMVAIDYGQLEACTGAMCSKDKYLVNALWNDYDIHYEWAVKIAERMPVLIGGADEIKNPEVMGKFRSLIKNKMVFPAFFGAQPESVRDYLCNATGFNVEQSLVDDIMDQFWATFAGVDQWQTKTMNNYYNVGYVETLNGRRHRYPLTRNEAINAPIQGTAAELVCDAMTRLSEMALKTGQWHLHPVLNIHDDLTFFVPEKEPIFSQALEIISREMLTFDYPWINVPMSIEISVGRNWADLKKLMKLWSHKDL